VSLHIETAAVHAGEFPAPENRPSAAPLYQASSYEFESLDDVEAVYAGRRRGAIYGRYNGPNAGHFASALAELERAEGAVGAASGMAAINAALAITVGHGERIVATREVYGGSYSLLERDYCAPRAEVVWVDQSDHAAVAAALAHPKARALYVEALTNPLMHVADLPALADLARRSGAVSIVDATFATPALCRPLEHGIDIVVHSVGKYLGGHGDVGAGVLAGQRPTVDRAHQYLARTGATIPHFEAWLGLRGLRTLALRMARHSSNALEVAAYLARAPGVERVYHPLLPENPQRELARRLYPDGTGGMLAFELSGGRQAVDRFLRGLRRIKIVHSLGEVATTIAYVPVSSHRSLPPEVRERIGIGEGTLRLSAGIEHPRDIIEDLERAFAGLSTAVAG
jgi:methionine-gamma-lyase